MGCFKKITLFFLLLKGVYSLGQPFISITSEKLFIPTNTVNNFSFNRFIFLEKKCPFLISPGIIATNPNGPQSPGCGTLNPYKTLNIDSAKSDGAVSYQWQSSVDNINFINIDGANSITYGFGTKGFDTTSYFRRAAIAVFNGDTCIEYSNTLTFIVYPLPEVKRIQPIGESIKICVGKTFQASNPTPDGIWTTDDNNIATIDNTGKITGIAASPSGFQIHYTVTNEYGCSKTANRTIYINPLPGAFLITHN